MRKLESKVLHDIRLSLKEAEIPNAYSHFSAGMTEDGFKACIQRYDKERIVLYNIILNAREMIEAILNDNQEDLPF